MSPSSSPSPAGRTFLLPPPLVATNVERKGHFVVVITPHEPRWRPLAQPAIPARIPLDSKVQGVGTPASSLPRAFRYPGLKALMPSGTQTADMFRRHAELSNAHQDELARFLLNNLRAAKPSGRDGKTRPLEGARVEAVMQASRPWEAIETRLRLVDAMARSLVMAGAAAAGHAGHTLRRRILSMQEPDRTLMVCAYANGFQDELMAVFHDFGITARRSRCDIAALHAIEAGLALQADPLMIYEPSSPVPPGPDRLRFAHLFATDAMGAPALSLDEIDARHVPPFDKAVLSTETVCRREPAVSEKDVSLLRQRLAHYAFLIPRSGVTKRHVLTAALVAQAPVPGPHVPLPHPHTLLGRLLAHAYDRLIRQAIEAASTARTPGGDSRAGERLHELIMFLGDEQLALLSEMPEPISNVIYHRFSLWTARLLKASTQTPSTSQ